MVSFEQVVDEEVDEGQTVPVIYEDNDDSEEEDSEALDTDQNGEYEEESDDVSDSEECVDMMCE